MTKDSLLGYLRSAMAIVGSLFLGHVILGHNVDNSILEGVSGGVLFVASTVWGIYDKTATQEMLLSALSKIVTFAGGLLVEKGIISGGTLVAIVGAIPMLAAEIWKKIQDHKDQRLLTGSLGASDLKVAQNIEDSGKSINIQLNTPQ